MIYKQTKIIPQAEMTQYQAVSADGFERVTADPAINLAINL